MRAALCWIATASVLLTSLVSQEPIDPAAAGQRLGLIALGSYQIEKQQAAPPGPSDVQLCMRALAADDIKLRGTACRAATAMAALPFFRELPGAQRHELAVLLIALLDTEHGRLAEGASGALRALVQRDGLLERRDLHSAIVQALGLTLRDDVESRRRSGLLLAAIVARADENIRQQVARTVITALERYPAAPDDDEREEIARAVLRSVLTRFDIRDRKLADELAAAFLADLELGEAWGFRYQRGDALRGLGHVFGSLPPARRQAALDVLRAAIGDLGLSFMTTSGRRSPLRHHGHEALAFAARSFTAAELESIASAAAAARRRAEQAGAHEMDVRGMYERLEASLASRSQALAR